MKLLDQPFKKKGENKYEKADLLVGNISRSNPFDGMYEVFYSQGNFKTFQMTGNGREPAGPTARGPLLALLGQGPVLKDLKFPFSVGQKWDYKHEFALIGAKKPLLRTAEISVTGFEQVTTPAGNFSAFRLEKVQSSRLGEHPQVGTFYYSPESKSVVKSFFDAATNGAGTKRQIELIKFGAAR